MMYMVALIKPPHDTPLFMTDDDSDPGEVFLFNSREEAEKAAHENSAAQAWGYEIYEWEWYKM